MKNQEILAKISKGAVLLLLGIVISKFFTYIYRLVIARYLGPEIYGIFSIGLAVIGFLLGFALLGMPSGLLRYVSFYKGKDDSSSIKAVINNGIKIILPITLLLAVILFIFAKSISIGIFHKPELEIVLKILAFAMPFSALATSFEYIIQGFKEIKYIVLSRGIIESLSKVILTVIAIYLGYSLWGISLAFTITMLIVAISFIYFFKKKIFIISRAIKIKENAYKKLLSFSLPLMFSDLFLSLLIWSDTLILGYFVTSMEVGIYNAAAPTAKLIHTIPVAIRALFIPTISELYAQEKSFKDIYISVTKWIFLTGMPVIILLCLYSKQLLHIFFGEIYNQGYLILILVAVCFFIYSIFFTAESTLMVIKKTKLLLFNTATTVIINIILNIILIPKYGILGAGIANFISFILFSILLASETYYFTRIFPFNLSYIKVLIASLIPLFIIILINDYFNILSLIGLIIPMSIYTAIYILLLLILKTFDSTEKELIKVAIKKIKALGSSHRI